MCWKFLVSVTVLVMASLLLVSITDASSSNDRDKSFSVPNKEKANWVAAADKAATVAKPAGHAQTDDDGQSAVQQDKLELSNEAQRAAQAATKVLNEKKGQLEMLLKRLVENQNTIDEGERVMALTTSALKRVLWLREVTSLGMQRMMRLHRESHANARYLKGVVAFAEKEEAAKTRLMGAAFHRLDSLKKSMMVAQAELKNIIQSAKQANNAAEEARQRIYMLRKLAPKIQLLNAEDLQTVKEFLSKRRHATHHST